MSKGIVVSAYMNGNSGIPYGDLAILSACLIKKQLGNIPISIFMDEKAKQYLETSHLGKLELFEERIDDFSSQAANFRQYAGTDGRLLQFNNVGRSSLYRRVAYDEMILIDTDYLMYEDSLKQVWGSREAIRINKTTTTARNALLKTVSRMGNLTIPIYWATVTYLRRCSETDNFFKLVEYVKQNYDWFSHVYRFERGLYRNDYAFSIAIHLLGGSTGYCPSVGSLPIDTLRFAWDDDQVVGYDDTGLWIRAHNHLREHGLIKTTDQSIHVLNKPSLYQHLPGMIDSAWNSIQ